MNTSHATIALTGRARIAIQLKRTRKLGKISMSFMGMVSRMTSTGGDRGYAGKDEDIVGWGRLKILSLMMITVRRKGKYMRDAKDLVSGATEAGGEEDDRRYLRSFTSPLSITKKSLYHMNTSAPKANTLALARVWYSMIFKFFDVCTTSMPEGMSRIMKDSNILG